MFRWSERKFRLHKANHIALEKTPGAGGFYLEGIFTPAGR
jgi:hypothetical protein